jgi:hypothetical protein
VPDTAVPTKPLLALFIVWHPAFLQGPEIAENLRLHFRRDLFGSVAGGTGLSVLYRSEPATGSTLPLDIDPGSAETTAIIVLADDNMAQNPDYEAYVADLSAKADISGLRVRVLPVSFSSLSVGVVKEQAIRFDKFAGDEASKSLRLISELTLELCRMLRSFLAHLEHRGNEDDELNEFLEPVRVFLSHSKHAGGGEAIAVALRGYLHGGKGLASFFDVNDIPAGLGFERVLLNRVRQSAVVAIHTDSFSSREWCRREIIEAKRYHVPLVVANCIGDRDERGFPYLGNVPIVRMDPSRIDRLHVVVGRILDEVLKDYLWKCRIRVVNASDPRITFVPRPPELISLTALPELMSRGDHILVYPDPPLSREEQRLFESVAPSVTLRSFTEWLAEIE